MSWDTLHVRDQDRPVDVTRTAPDRSSRNIRRAQVHNPITAIQAILRLPSKHPGITRKRALQQTSRWYPFVPLETSGFAWDGERRQCRKLRIQRLSRERRTSRTGTFFEAHRLAKRVLDLHLAEREPFLKSGAEQKVMDTAKVEGQDRDCHIVPFQYR
jgi:hypothetical protein